MQYNLKKINFNIQSFFQTEKTKIYSLPLFKKIMSSLKPEFGDAIYGDGSIIDPTKSNYWLKQIAHGQADSSGLFDRTPNQRIDTFYKSWLDLIKNHLGRGESQYFEKHRGKLLTLEFAASEDVYMLIDNALEDAFGYTAFISLLSGIMTFSEDITISGGYKVDFWSHDNRLQVSFLNEFVGRHLGDRYSTSLSPKYLTSVPRYKYFASLFLFGAKRGDRIIKPSSNFFIDNYYKEHILFSTTDYNRATRLFLDRSFSEFLGEPKKVLKLNEMNLKGRLEIFNFLSKKMNEALDKMGTTPENRKIFLDLLMKRITNPKGDENDYTTILREIFFTGSNGRFSVSVFGILEVSFEVTYSELINDITPNQLFTMLFSRKHRMDKGYYLDFDLIWKDLAPKVKEAYNLIKKVISETPQGKRVDFYQRTTDGIETITEKSRFVSTLFSKSHFYINPNNKEDLESKVISMLFWMIMEPNLVPVVRTFPTSDIILILDIFGIYNENQFSGTLTGDYIPPSSTDQNQFSNIFNPSDIVNFVNFHNHEQSDIHSDMISYVKEKFEKLYMLLGGKDWSELVDLR
jgi:hypothetical protein